MQREYARKYNSNESGNMDSTTDRVSPHILKWGGHAPPYFEVGGT